MNRGWKGHPATIWLASSFAPEWFKDSVRESKEKRINARRREIVFLVCCVESYLVEWVRDSVLKRSYAERTKDDSGNLLEYDDETKCLQTFFPRNRMGIKGRWKHVLKKLNEKRLLHNIPDFKTAIWQEFCELVDYRDGLVHATVSLPDTEALSKDEKPIPSPRDLAKQQGGWAVQRTVNLLRQLHKVTGTPEPAWLSISDLGGARELENH